MLCALLALNSCIGVAVTLQSPILIEREGPCVYDRTIIRALGNVLFFLKKKQLSF